MFFLLYSHTDDVVFDDFTKISDHFPKISNDSQTLVWRWHERCRTFSEDYRILRKTYEEEPKLLWWYANEFEMISAQYSSNSGKN